MTSFEISPLPAGSPEGGLQKRSMTGQPSTLPVNAALVFGKESIEHSKRLSPVYEVPDRWTFYKEGMRRHFFEKRQEGNDRFYHQVLMNKKRRWMLFSGVTVLSILLAAARGPVRTLMHVGIMAALMPLPILGANKAMPKLADAYEVARQGNPRQADRMFADAVDEFSYSVFQRFFKPISYAVVLTTLLTLPQNLAKPKTQWKVLMEYYVKQGVNNITRQKRFVVQHPHANEESRNLLESMLCWPLERLDRLFAPNKGKWSEWLGAQVERFGWKRQYQPYPVLKQLNLKLQSFGDEWEDWMREKPLLNRMLGKPQSPG